MLLSKTSWKALKTELAQEQEKEGLERAEVEEGEERIDGHVLRLRARKRSRRCGNCLSPLTVTALHARRPRAPSKQEAGDAASR